VKIYIFSKTGEPVTSQTLKKVPAEIVPVIEGESSSRKLRLLDELGDGRTAAIGNGEDDAAMIERAAIGIAVLGKEGTAGAALRAADLVVTDVLDGLEFLLNPLRQRTTLGT